MPIEKTPAGFEYDLDVIGTYDAAWDKDDRKWAEDNPEEAAAVKKANDAEKRKATRKRTAARKKQEKADASKALVGTNKSKASEKPHFTFTETKN